MNTIHFLSTEGLGFDLQFKRSFLMARETWIRNGWEVKILPVKEEHVFNQYRDNYKNEWEYRVQGWPLAVREYLHSLGEDRWNEPHIFAQSDVLNFGFEPHTLFDGFNFYYGMRSPIVFSCSFIACAFAIKFLEQCQQENFRFHDGYFLDEHCFRMKEFGHVHDCIDHVGSIDRKKPLMHFTSQCVLNEWGKMQ